MASAKSNLLQLHNPLFLKVILTMTAFFCAQPLDALVLPLPQTIEQQTHGAMAISGHVLDQAGKPISNALIKLHIPGAERFDETTTDALGGFKFKDLRFGRYIMTAEKSGVRSKTMNVVVSNAAFEKVLLVLEAVGSEHREGTPPFKLPSQEIEFSDKPDFAVAGVTDWTAVGGHGSDATLRTSENLVRETLTLKAPETNEGMMKRSAGGIPETEARFQAALNDAPTSYEATHNLGEYYLHTAKYEQAIPLLRSALDLSEDKAEDDYALALAYQGLGDLALARQYIQRALGAKERADFHHLAGELDEKEGDPLAAVKELEHATLSDGSEENYFAWGSELLLHRAVWEAAEVFRDGARAYPTSARMKAAWGTALFAGALYEQASQQVCAASDLDPTDIKTYLTMGQIEIASPMPLSCAEERLGRFVKVYPQNADAAFFYAMALSKQNKVQNRVRIQDLLARAVMLNPNYSDAYLQLGALSFAQHRYQEAISFYKSAITANPQNGEAHYRLALTYDRTGEKIGASQELLVHEQIEKAQADATERQRRDIKQFVVVPHVQPAVQARP